MKPACHAEVRGVPVRWKLPHAARHSSGSRADGASRAPISFPVFTCRLTCSALQQTSQILQCATCSSSDVFQKADPPLVAEADADRRMFRGESWMKECLWKQRPGWRRQAAVGVLLGKPGVYIGGEDVSAAAFCLFFCLFLPAGSIMLLRALLQTSLVLWLAQQTLQGGVSPQNVAFGRALPVRGVGVGVKPGVTGALGAVGNRYGTKAMKTGLGRYPAAHLGVGGYRSLGLGGRGGLKPGGYGTPAGYGASLGTGMGLNAGLTNGLGLGQAGKRVYGAGLGQLPGYGAFPGIGYQGVRPGYIGGAGNYLGTAGYGAGLGQGAYLGGAAGKLSAAAALGQGAYPQGVAGKSNGYGDGVTGYLGAMAGNGFGYGNGYGDGYGAGLGYPADLADGAESKSGKIEALSTGGYAGPVQGGYGGLGTGLESVGGKYGGAAQVPYGNAPVIPAGLEGDGGYPYAAQQLGLAAESAKTASKYGAAAGFGTQQTGFGAALGASQDALMEQTGKYDGLNAGLGNGYKG
ncbi:glycine-rich cell wall structural protein isoform X11 [Xiphophorus hellerii]|uniref:glycine-rich cell wall structural protein isoform X11 n=1 Tax=Xiphophorus hellerii TaxID=8084 RepID=UPI0013B3CF2A|nr:glycine-rich cell wall structural protein-like isoform X11 [Xiphophorus hellerii]